ncbi:MAG: YfiR family protein [bacterium]|nr:YfiR family protein [bacterium]
MKPSWMLENIRIPGIHNLGTVLYRIRLCAVLFLLTLCVLSVSIQGHAQITEYRLKAAFLYNFAKFIEWPEKGSDSGEFILGIYGEDPFGDALDSTILGKTVKGHTLTVRYCSGLEEIKGCRILFAGSSELKMIKELAGLPILLVGEDDKVIENGGIVEFFMEDQRIRFRIHAGRAEKAGLKISSKILRLATDVIYE